MDYRDLKDIKVIAIKGALIISLAILGATILNAFLAWIILGL